MIKNIWGKLSYYFFVGMLLIVGLFTGDLKVQAQTTTQWGTEQVKINTCDGNGTCTDSSNYDGDHTFSSSALDYPINFVQWRLKSSQGLSKENYYTFTFGYKPTPDAIAVRIQPNFKKAGNYADENISCNQTYSSGWYKWTCSFEPRENYSSDEFLYVRITFYQDYITKLETTCTGYKVMQGVSGTINESTNTIINNNNTNTNNIINNQNQNTQNQIESQQVCKVIDKTNVMLNGKFLRDDGTIADNSIFGITDYIRINPSSKLKVTSVYSSGASYCLYDVNKTIINCYQISTLILDSYINLPSNVYYLRSSIQINANKPTFQLCDNGNQALSDDLKDDSIDSPDDMISDFEDMLPSNGVITQLIGLPITLYTKILNSINGTCSQFNLGSLYNHNLIIPCIDVSTYLGTSIWNTIDLIISGAFVLIIAKKMIKAFENFTSMKDGDVINND